MSETVDEAKPERPLPRRMRLFVERYCLHLNGTKAAKEAGYSEDGASVTAARLLAKAKVKDAVRAILADRSHQNAELAEKVMRELEIIALSDIGDVIEVTPEGRRVLIKPLDALTPEQRRCILEITQHTAEFTDAEGVVHEKVEQRVKLHPKITALSQLAKILGLESPTRFEHTGKDGKPIKAVVKNAGRLSDAVADELMRKVLAGERGA